MHVVSTLTSMYSVGHSLKLRIGTMGMLHGLLNSPIHFGTLSPVWTLYETFSCILPDEDAPLAKIRKDCTGKTPAERASYLETSTVIEAAHSSVAQSGQSRVSWSSICLEAKSDRFAKAPTSDEEVDLHFSCFVTAEVDGKSCLVELDGRRPGPINRELSNFFHLSNGA